MVASSPNNNFSTAGKHSANTPSNEKGSPAMTDCPVTPKPSKTRTNTTVGTHRPPDTDDPLLLSIAANQAVLVQQLITITCYIPTNSVGAVIGRRGATVAQIQKQAQQTGTSNGAVRLSIAGNPNSSNQKDALMGNGSGNNDFVSSRMGQGVALAVAAPLSPNPAHTNMEAPALMTQHTPIQQQQQSTATSVPYTYTELDWSSPAWTPIVIRADPCAALTAATLLKEKVGPMDDIVMDVPLGRAKHAAVVGRRGYVLANLSADSNVRIMVPRRELRHDIIQLEGQLDKVKQCLERVLAIASDSAAANATNAASATANNNSNNNNANSIKKKGKNNKNDKTRAVVIKMPDLPSVTKLRNIGRKSDTLIKKKKADDKVNWDLTITGNSMESVQSAVAILRKWSDDKQTALESKEKASIETRDSTMITTFMKERDADDASSTSNTNINNSSKNNTTPKGNKKGRWKQKRPRGKTRNRNNDNNSNNDNANSKNTDT